MSPEQTEVLQAFAVLRRHLPASLRPAEAELEAAWFNGGPLPIDWPARFRKAADAADDDLFDGDVFRVVANNLEHWPTDRVEAIGRPLLGEPS